MKEIILEEMKRNSYITENILARKYGVSERTIRRYVKVLKEEGKIKLIRDGKIRYWVVYLK